MNQLAQFNDVMAYLERNLMQDIDPAQISHLAGCSEYHFRRMFSFLAGMPLGEYIRRRRLSLAGILLRSGQVKIIDLALQLGYESPEAFSKAFQAMHGVSPSQVKKEKVELKILPPMTFQLTIKGGIEMNYRIVEKGNFCIAGFKERTTLQFKGINPRRESLLQKLTPQVITELKSLCTEEPEGMLSISANFHERTLEGSELDQYIGVATTKTVPDKYDTLQVEASVWAVFKTAGSFPDAIQDTWARIYAEWLPASGYELTGGPELLWCETPDTSRSDYKSEIWIPVRKN